MRSAEVPFPRPGLDRVARPAAAARSAVAVASVRPVVAARETFGFSTESKTPCAYLKSQDVKDMYGESVQRSGHRTSSSADHVQ